MSEEDGHNTSSFSAYHTSKAAARPYIKDADLQIHMPESKEAIRAKNMETFKNIYAHYANQRARKNSPHAEAASVAHEVQHEMEEAKLTYAMMMDISHAISEAYNELKKGQ